MRPVLLIYERVTTPTALPSFSPPVITLPGSKPSFGSPTLPKPNADTKPELFGSSSLVPNTSPDFIPFTDILYLEFLVNLKNVLPTNENLKVLQILTQHNQINLKINGRTIEYTLINDVYSSDMSNFKISELHLNPDYSFIMMTEIDFVNITTDITTVTHEKKYFGTLNIDYIILVEPHSQVKIYFLWSIPTSFINTWVIKKGVFYQGKKKLHNFFKDDRKKPISFFNLDIIKSYLILDNSSNFYLSDDQDNHYISFSLKKFFSKKVTNEIVKTFKNEVDDILKKINPAVKTVICQEDMLLVFLNIDDLKLTAALNKGQPLYTYLYNQQIDLRRLEFTNTLNCLLDLYDDCAYYSKNETDKKTFGILKLKAGDIIQSTQMKQDGFEEQINHTLIGNIYYYPSLQYNLIDPPKYSPCLIMTNEDYYFFFDKKKIINEPTRNFVSKNRKLYHVHDFQPFEFFNLKGWIFNTFENEEYCFKFEATKSLKMPNMELYTEVCDYQIMGTVKKNTPIDLTSNPNFILFVRYTDLTDTFNEYIAFPLFIYEIVQNTAFLSKVDNNQSLKWIQTENLIIITYAYKDFLKKLKNEEDYYDNLINGLDTSNTSVNDEFIKYINMYKDISV